MCIWSCGMEFCYLNICNMIIVYRIKLVGLDFLVRFSGVVKFE